MPTAQHVNIGNEKLRRIAKHVHEGSVNPRVVSLARRIVGGVTPKDYLAEARAIWEYLCTHSRYVRDPKGMEVFQSAERFLFPVEDLPAELAATVGEPIRCGDCDETGAIVAGAMLRAIGQTTRLGLWAPPNGDWQHIFTWAWNESGKCWVAIDPTEPTRPFGWRPATGRFEFVSIDDADGIKSRNVCDAPDLPRNVRGPLKGKPASQLSGYGSATAQPQLGGGLDSFFKNLGKDLEKIGGQVWNDVKGAIPAIATAASTFIPGVGPMLAPLIGNLTNGLVNRGAPNPAIDATMQAIRAGQSPIAAVAGSVTGVPAIGQMAAQVFGSFVPELNRNPIVYAQALAAQQQANQQFANGGRAQVEARERAMQQQLAEQRAQQIAQQQAQFLAQQSAMVAPQYAAQALYAHPQAAQQLAQRGVAPQQAQAMYAQQVQREMPHVLQPQPTYQPQPAQPLAQPQLSPQQQAALSAQQAAASMFSWFPVASARQPQPQPQQQAQPAGNFTQLYPVDFSQRRQQAAPQHDLSAGAAFANFPLRRSDGSAYDGEGSRSGVLLRGTDGRMWGNTVADDLVSGGRVLELAGVFDA